MVQKWEEVPGNGPFIAKNCVEVTLNTIHFCRHAVTDFEPWVGRVCNDYLTDPEAVMGPGPSDLAELFFLPRLCDAWHESAEHVAPSTRMPECTKAVFGWLTRVKPQATCTSVVFAWNMVAPMHADWLNVGPTWLTAVGEFTRGGLWVSAGGANQTGRVLLLAGQQWQTFDSLWPHCGLPFKGERCYSCIRVCFLKHMFGYWMFVFASSKTCLDAGCSCLLPQ